MIPSRGEGRENAVDRREMEQLVGRRVAVRLNSAEARGVEMIATLDEAREDGIVLSEVGELGEGPTMFCPWDSLRRVRERPPWLRPPHEEPEGGETWEWESYELREVSPEATEPEPPAEHRRSPSARTLERVVPLAQKRTVGGITVALASLELYGDGLGMLRYLIHGEDVWWGVPEPELVLRDGAGRELSWSPRSSGSSDGEADGEIEVWDLPDSGEIEAEVSRLVFREFSPEKGEEEETDSYDGPWSFRFSL